MKGSMEAMQVRRLNRESVDADGATMMFFAGCHPPTEHSTWRITP